MKKTLRFVCFLSMLVMILSLTAACAKKDENSKYKTTIKIECTKIFDHEADLNPDKKDFVPKDGIILDTVEVKIGDDQTVYDQLVKACEAHKISFASQKSDYGMYVDGIAQIQTADCGEMSGWLFYVNDEMGAAACDQIVLKEGDSVKWVFICDYSTDVK
ncbi:MAG: DUF4430 domain-containing protein [Clostridia bacterium]|nr:DUF4430 domain-containing protein [Clostridia bacterium]MBQ5956725.1 DUF4430 domain-containing protein [Clostridia bacterium]MBR3563633.1 DUF4430 domain-containing protein [Clostridia bacterium]MBR6135846.1 DUF4430 domain-containing protein [Clostridia bacterium]